ncbi:phosphotransferase [Variovorax sp. KK3]|uniref:phosphotransferase n=1 Tax=Variovorax sp. KK3 TaxID=1855728 RepID=UPI0021189937|nr:phosphotransferase [Variovorax sp. KK3]
MNDSSTPAADAVAAPAGGLDALQASALDAFIRRVVGSFDGALGVRQVEGGQSNPTFIVDAGSRRLVLRRKPPGVLLPSAHAVEREFRVLRALQGSDVPVPRALALCEDPAVIGSSFYLMDFAEGRILTDQTLPGMSPGERRAHYAEMARVMAALHAVDWRSRGLADFGREGRYVERQLDRWTRQYRASETARIDAMERLIEWLPAHVPAQESTQLVHGDFRLDNLVFHAHEPRIVAVLDWELSTLGDPLVDFAYHCLSWRLQLGTHRTLAGLEPLPEGIPTEAQHVADYCRASGRAVGLGGAPIAHWHYHLAFNMFRLAAIQQGVARRALDGNAANSKAAAVAARVQTTAETGWAAAKESE